MLPIRNFSDISTFMEKDYGLVNTPFNIMALYRSEHKEYRQYILSEFIKIHELTLDISFIVCDQPPDGWIEREDAQYYQKLVGDDYRPQLNDFEIEVVCRYMDIPLEALPCVVCFNDITRYSFNCFSFSKVEIRTIKLFFDSLLEKTAMFSFQSMDYTDTMIKLRREFPNCGIYIKWDRDNIIENRLKEANNDIRFYRSPEGQGLQAKPLRKLTPLQIVKQSCQAKAQQLWRQKPDMTIEALIHDTAFLSCFDGTSIDRRKSRTLRDWVKDFCPDRTPGRRPNS